MLAFFNALLVRDLRIAMRRRSEALLPLGFVIIAVALFPLCSMLGALLIFTLLTALPASAAALRFAVA